MARYYDEKCLRCGSCHFFGYGNFPDGRPYERCGRYGYILHPEKGVGGEECEGFRTNAQYETEQKMKNRKAR